MNYRSSSACSEFNKLRDKDLRQMLEELRALPLQNDLVAEVANLMQHSGFNVVSANRIISLYNTFVNKESGSHGILSARNL